MEFPVYFSKKSIFFGLQEKNLAVEVSDCSRQTILTTTSQEENANISQEEKATIIIKQKFLEYVLNQ